MEKNKMHKNDTTIDNVIRNTISMCITGCLAGRYHDAANSRIATEFTASSIRIYLENYIEDYGVDLFLNNIYLLMRNIFNHTTKEDSELSISSAIFKVASSMSDHLDGDWKELLFDVFPEGIKINYSLIKLLDEIEFTESEIMSQLNKDLLNKNNPDVAAAIEEEDKNIIFEDENMRISRQVLDLNNLPEDLPKSIMDFLSKIAGEPENTPTVDEDTKEIGDIVHIPHIINAAYLVSYPDKKQIWKNDKSLADDIVATLVGKPAIVIGTNEDVYYKCNNCDEDHDADLLIHFEHDDKKYYISSDFVSLLSNTII
jgi:hypothetical protein